MTNRLQNRLLILAGGMLCLYAVGLSISPAVQTRLWPTALRWTHWLALTGWALIFTLANQQTQQWLTERDPYILPLTALLSGWGLLTIWRLSPAFGLRQTIWTIFAGLVLIAGLRLSPTLHFLRRYKYILLGSGLLLTALTLIFGTNPAGSGPRLWLGCCGIYIQPSEPLKLLLVIYLAAYLADRPRAQLRGLGFLAPTFILSGTALLLLLVQRDLGTASIFICLQTLVLYLATGKKRVLLLLAAILLLAGVVGYFFVDIVRLRLTAWLHPWADPAGSGYQIIQSLLAVANGGFFGRGPGLGNPGLVPVAHSDFIFSAIAEETGLLGSAALLGAIALLVTRGFHIALQASGHFRRLLASGLSTYLAIQTILIVGGNLRLLPLTGVTLPFVSYGGTSLLSAFLASLLLLLISNNEENPPVHLPNPQPYSLLNGLLLLGLGASLMVNGWWAVVRGPDLLTRTDNPRRALADRYVRRGSLLDRNDAGITVTRGQTGSFRRVYLYSPLAPMVGYTHSTYGQAGLEASLDPYLRGLQGNPASLIWWHHLLYGQPPPGLDVRLSLDLKLQKRADELLGNHRGAVVLVNAGNGEILVMASHPTYDPEKLESSGSELLAAKDSPLLNRAVQSAYPPGTALAPFLLAATYENLPALPANLWLKINGQTIDCLRPPSKTMPDWAYAVQNGCPAAVHALGNQIGTGGLLSLFDGLGFYTVPQVRLPAAPVSDRQIKTPPGAAALGLSGLKISPLQMVLAAAALSNDGLRPAPHLAMTVNTPQQGWVVLPPVEDTARSYPPGATSSAVQSLIVTGQPYWQASGKSLPDKETYTWYLGGSLPNWQGTPFAIVVLLEEDNPYLAEHIGQTILQAALNQK